MGIVESEADEILKVIKEEEEISAGNLASKLEFDKSYVKKICYVLDKKGLVEVDTNYLNLTVRTKDQD